MATICLPAEDRTFPDLGRLRKFSGRSGDSAPSGSKTLAGTNQLRRLLNVFSKP